MQRRNKAFFPNKKDHTGAELVAVLLEGRTCRFEEIFQVIHSRMKARNMAKVGEEMLRLRAYEKLRALVAEGAVKKTENTYRAVLPSLRALQAQSLAPG